MDNCTNNNQTTSNIGTSNSAVATPLPHEHTRSAYFDYTTHTPNTAAAAMADYDDMSSNKSTPYYTPMEFVHSTFDFPSPTKLEHMTDITEVHRMPEQKLEAMQQCKTQTSTPTPTTTPTPATPTSRSLAHTRQHLSSSSTSPVVSRKLRRFSLYERRSCSPQQLLLKHTVSASMESGGGGGSYGNNSSSTITTECLADKENAKPVFRAERRDTLIRSSSGNSSPAAIIDVNAEAPSPKILESAMAARLPCSPKLLTSLNNLNLTGSPLGVISSAGYKNGNYFKFPEIDQMVQDVEREGDRAHGTSVYDNQNRNGRQRGSGSNSKERKKSSNSNGNNQQDNNKARVAEEMSAMQGEIGTKSSAINSATPVHIVDCKKNRKNKNNLTIKITDVPYNAMTRMAQPIGNAAAATSISASASPSPSPSASSKPKTPTIKNTKEKALSLDSAARDSELTIIVSSSGRNNSHASCDEIDAQTLQRSCLPIQHCMSRSMSGARFEKLSAEQRGLRLPAASGSAAASNRSTSLSQLALLGVDGGGLMAARSNLQTQSLCPSSTTSSLKTPLSGNSFPRTPRRRLTGGVGCGGGGGSINASVEWLAAYHRNRNSADASSASAADMEVDMSTAAADMQQQHVKVNNEGRAENPNTLLSAPHGPVTATLSLTPHRNVHKHNTMLHASNTNLKTLPEFLTLVEFSTTTGTGSGAHQPHKQKSMELPNVAMSRPKPIASVSSTNLLQRRGSNHSLTLNLHGSCGNLLGNCRSGLSVSNYSLGTAHGNSTTNLNSKSSCNLDLSNTPIIQQPQPQAAATQGAKQSLFRRRGSNQSLTLSNLTAASCSNLNTFASQNSLNKVTRTASFATPTQNTTSNVVSTKRGLLERRGSNQSLTLNMGGSFGGIGAERHMHGSSSLYLGDACAEASELSSMNTKGTSCQPPTPHRRFFSSESLNRGATPFADLNQAHRRNAKQVCFGSVSDLKPSSSKSLSLDCAANSSGAGSAVTSTAITSGTQPTMGELRRDSFNFQESTVCSCTGVRNIVTRPLSPQSTSEEFKIYLANIQMLQNASNTLNQLDLIKLNYIFDNSYASSNKGLAEQAVPMLSVRTGGGVKEAETPPAMRITTSEDSEVAERYLAAVQMLLATIQPDDDEQKRIFCDLHKEFWDLPLNHQEKPMVFGSQAKNRYKTILPNENSRVLLEKEGKQLAELAEYVREEHRELAEHITQMVNISDDVPYINANFIKGPDYTSKCYVATQGPLPNTIFDFWLMVYQNTRRYFQTTDNKAGTMQYYQKVIMLTNFAENNRQKCAIYFPIELNEVIITTNWNEIITPTAEAIAFFNAYLLPKRNEATPPQLHLTKCGSALGVEPDKRRRIGIEYYHAVVNEELQTFLPPTKGNYFVIKNLGIVRKNGFSIRKFVLLYCINLGASATQPQSTQLLIHRFYCYHYWYPDWPDHRSPCDINTLLDICLHILNLGKCEAEFEAFENDDDENDAGLCREDKVDAANDNVITAPKKFAHVYLAAQPLDIYQQDIFNAMQPLPIIHCSAGIGRTGCLTAILNAIRQLRQSFAYSLTTMAAEASEPPSIGGGGGGGVGGCDIAGGGANIGIATGTGTDSGSELAAQALLSPVDFELPVSFVAQAQHNIETAAVLNDTDSSFTRNTLYYINYILQQHQQQQQQQQKPQEPSDSELMEKATTAWPLTTIQNLPKIPDIYVDILGIVCNLRLQRGGMVQNSEQYELIHRAICLYMKRTFALKLF